VRSSHSTQLATARAIAECRDIMAAEWTEWLGARGATGSVPVELVRREHGLVIDTLIEMLGPLRREAKPLWTMVMEHYGRTAATRGLAAGEVVEEIQQLRFLLVRYIGATVAAMRPRRAVAVFLRLNHLVDRGIAQAVVGYTDALVASLMMTDRQTQPLTEVSPEELARQLGGLEERLTAIASRR
jgi:hypothetical protein